MRLHLRSRRSKDTQPRHSGPLRWLRLLGPGLITGAADDDPSGIATYSQTGAQFGFGQLWTALYQMPLLLAVQECCGRIGAVTGKGLARVIKDHHSPVVLKMVVLLVLVANTINIGADIAAVAEAAQLVVDAPQWLYAALLTLIVAALEIRIRYAAYARVLKWLALALLSYPATALIIDAPWSAILHATLVPHLEFSFEFLFIITGVFGTTISPYMFFWQASEEVEEEIALQLATGDAGPPQLPAGFLQGLRIDTAIGMAASQLVQWFIIVTTGTVLYAHGITQIDSAAEAARALEPLVQSFHNAGQLARVLFAVGVIGLGLLGIPVLAGSAAYALSEALDWREGLSKTYAEARGFYGIIVLALGIGLMLNFTGVDPMKALVWTAVFNGIASVPLLWLIARINGNAAVLGAYRGGPLSRLFVWLAVVVMTLSAAGVLYTLMRST